MTKLPEQFLQTALPKMKEGLRKIKAWFERAGYPPSATILTELETEFTQLFRDHIALELDFMRFLCEQEMQGWKNGDGHRYLEEENSFMNEHIIKWIPAFCEKILELNASDFYLGVADLTEGWFECDLKIIQELREKEWLWNSRIRETIF